MSSYVPTVLPLSRRDIESCAERLVKQFFPYCLNTPGPFPVLMFFDSVLPDAFGLDTGVEELSDGVEGMTWPDGRVLLSPDTYAMAAAGQGRARFTTMHESFHGIQHQKQIRRVLSDTGRITLHRRGAIPPYLDPEWQANVFAAAAMMPANMVEYLGKRVSKGMLPFEMARVFQVSSEAAQIRAEQVLG
jgi:hypothetical protein